MALALALREPGDVAGLVLLSGYYFPSLRADVALGSWPAVPVRGRHSAVHDFAPARPADGADSLPQAVRALAGSPALCQRIPARTRGTAVSIRASAAETTLMISGAAGLAGHYPKLTIPVAIVAGLGDKIVDFQPPGRAAGRGIAAKYAA